LKPLQRRQRSSKVDLDAGQYVSRVKKQMPNLRHGLRWLLILACAAVATAASVTAHEIRPAIVTATIGPTVDFTVDISLNIEALLAGIGPEHKDTNDAPEAATYKALRELDAEALQGRFSAFAERWLAGVQLEFNANRMRPHIARVAIPAVGDVALARISVIQLAGKVPPDATTMRWTYAAAFGSSVVRVKREGQETLELGWLKDGQASTEVALAGSATQSSLGKFVNYVSVGFTHIVPKGLDHILFVLGLYLLGTSWRPLLVQVTAFTVAHSITLGLGLYGVVNVSAAVVEPLIALSIVYVAVENILTGKLHVWRPVIVFAFGLLHGLGFAGILQEIGLPRADYVVGLVGFNIGVEMGQLAVIGAAFLVTGLWFRHKTWYRPRIVWPASAAIALTGAFWTVERIWFA
jgi:HupE / UreJ protein